MSNFQELRPVFFDFQYLTYSRPITRNVSFWSRLAQPQLVEATHMAPQLIYSRGDIAKMSQVLRPRKISVAWWRSLRERAVGREPCPALTSELR
jgi:hypothetical protein